MCGVTCKGCEIGKKTKHSPSRTKSNRWKRIVFWIGMVSLVVAYAFGKINSQPDYASTFKTYFDEAKIDHMGKDIFRITISDTLYAHLNTAGNNGYGGPLEVAVAVQSDSLISDVVVVSERETQSFFNKLVNRGFFDQFKGLSVTGRFDLGQNVDGVSGATVSSVAFTHAIEKAAYDYAALQYGIHDLLDTPDLTFGTSEVAILALLVWSIALYYKKNKVLQTLMHLSALVLIGFYLNLSISITNLGSVLQGYFPNMYDHLVWYILIIGVLAVALIFGKNIYCYRICPFYAVQWLSNKISGINLRPDQKIGAMAKYVSGVLLWASLLVGFLTATPSSGSYEPFATMFSFDGEGVQWFILPAIFFSSFFIKDVFCRYYCPVGGFMKFVIREVRQPIFKQIKQWQNRSKAKQALS